MSDFAAEAPSLSIESRILLVRGQKVLLDADLAELYGVPTKAFNQAVKRNRKRFPEDFMFRLTLEEGRYLDGSIASMPRKSSRSKGIAMLASVLNSERAILVSFKEA